MNKLYPMFLKLNGKICVVIGGGNVAYRKVVTLIETGANIKVVSPVFIEPLLHFSKAGKIELRQKKYSVDDLNGAFLVFVAIGSKDITKKIIEDAHARGALCNVVNDRHVSDFFVPSIFMDGDLKIAISTNGRYPAAASKIKSEIANFYSNASEIIEILGEFRDKVIKKISDPDKRKRILLDIVKDIDFYHFGKSHKNQIEEFRNEISKWF